MLRLCEVAAWGGWVVVVTVLVTRAKKLEVVTVQQVTNKSEQNDKI